MYFFIFNNCGFRPFWNSNEVTNFGKTIFLLFFVCFFVFKWVSVLGECKIEIQNENRIKIGFIHFELCLLYFFVQNVNFDQFWKNCKFQNKILTNVNSLKLILKKTVPSMIFRENRIRFILFLLINGCILFKNPKFSRKFRKLPMTITSEPNIETWNLCQNVYFWILYCIPLITLFWPKVDLGPFGNELFIYK